MQMLAVVFFPNTDVEKINKFREKYDQSWKIIAPHITLVSPLATISENQLIEHVKTIIKDVPSFQIHINGLHKIFDEYIFLQVKEGKEEIINLHDSLYSGIVAPFLPTDFLFSPHITLGSFNTKNALLYAHAYTEAEEMNFDITCAFDALSVIKGDGVSPSEIVTTIPLIKIL